MRPTAFSACASSASHTARSARSPTKDTASSGFGEDLIAAERRSSLTSANTVRTPSPTSACAMARPMPLPAPVTSAVSWAGSNRELNRLIDKALSKFGGGAMESHCTRRGQTRWGTWTAMRACDRRRMPHLDSLIAAFKGYARDLYEGDSNEKGHRDRSGHAVVDL